MQHEHTSTSVQVEWAWKWDASALQASKHVGIGGEAIPSATVMTCKQIPLESPLHHVSKTTYNHMQST